MSENEDFMRWYMERYGRHPENERLAIVGKQLWRWSQQQKPLEHYRKGAANMRRRDERRVS